MKNWTIGKRITVGFAVIVTLSAIMGILAWISMRNIGGHADTLANDNIPGLSKSADVLQRLNDAHLTLIRAILTTNAADRLSHEAKMKEIGVANSKALDDLEKVCDSPEEKAL